MFTYDSGDEKTHHFSIFRQPDSSSTDEEEPTLKEDVQKGGGVEEKGEVQKEEEEDKPVEEGQPEALSVTMFYRKKSPPPTVDGLSLQVDRALSIFDKNILLESTSDLMPMSAPPTQIDAAEPHHRAVSPEIHGLLSPLGLELISSTYIPGDCVPLENPTKEVNITSSQMSGSSGPVTSQSTPKAMPRISQEPSEELTPVTKKLQESLPVMIRPDTRRGRGGRSRRQFEAVHLTSPEVVKERHHLLEKKERKEKEKKERAAERLKKKMEILCEVIGKARQCLEKKQTGKTTKKKKRLHRKKRKLISRQGKGKLEHQPPPLRRMQ